VCIDTGFGFGTCEKLCRGDNDCAVAYYCYSVSVTVGGVLWGVCE
jgi:hypothetical protein